MKSTSSNPQDQYGIDSFIQDWIRIDKKDPDYVREAKLKARKDFVDLTTTLIQQAEIRGRIEELKSIQTEWYTYGKGELSPRPNEMDDWLGAAIYDRLAELQAKVAE